MKFALGKAIVLGLAVAAASFTGCSSDRSKSNSAVNHENAGELGLQLQVGSLTVNSVHYVLTNGTNSYTGDLDVTDASSLNAVIGGVIAGTGYNLTLTATATDGTSLCTGAAGPFTVTANQTVTVAVELRCTKVRNKGSVLIDGTVNECPDISSVVGDAPRNCTVGLHVAATDDGKPNPPGALTYTWTGAPGLTGANPVLNCAASGPVALTVNVSDGDVDPTCSQTFGVTVICPPGCPLVPASCTDLLQNQNESDVDCGGTQVPSCPRCANGQHCVAGTDCVTGTCTGGFCANAPSCTDGIQNGTETGIDCGGSCPNPCPSPTQAALTAHNANCLTCANSKAACRNLINNFSCEATPGNAAAGPAIGTARSTLCLNLLNKMLLTTCGSTSDGASVCYCGTHTSDCFTAGGDGAAKAEEEAGLETTTPATIEGNFSLTTLGGGRANQIMQCLNDNGCTSCF